LQRGDRLKTGNGPAFDTGSRQPEDGSAGEATVDLDAALKLNPKPERAVRPRQAGARRHLGSTDTKWRNFAEIFASPA
jgi:hypothetical protein